MTAPQYEPLTPVEIERQIRYITNQMTQARTVLADCREDEVKAKHAFESVKRRVVLSAECPKVARGGHTVLDRDCWVDERTSSIREAYEVAKVRREAAEDHLKTLFQQGMLAATLAKSVHQAFAMSGTGDR